MIKRFMQLFAGLERAYGTYRLTGGTSDKGKAEGKAVTVQQPVTEQLWQDHLDGKTGLGIVPIRDDNTCLFGVIDVDEYDLDLASLEKKIKKLKFPLTILRTKSGGAHLYVWLKEPAQAADVRHAMLQFALMLGYAPDIEIFPKQDQLAGPEDVGNWINMPYFDHGRTVRYAIHKGKAVADAEAFLTLAEKSLVDIDHLLELTDQHVDDVLTGAPPCLITMANTGVPEGARNDAMFSFTVFAFKKYKDDFLAIQEQLNQSYMLPPLGIAELKAMAKSLGKKDYFYKCKGLAAICNKKACAKCEYGIGDGPEDPGLAIDGITKICSDPPTWVVQINGKRIRMETEELLNQPRFGKRCVETINYLPPTLKAHKWGKFINAMLQDRREIEAPPDAGPQGQFLYHLEQFCTTKAPANNREELLLGKPWHDEDHRTYFRAADLFKYLEHQRFRGLRENQIFALLHDVSDVGKHGFNLKGKFVNCWSVPSFNMQTEEHTVPRVEPEEF